jgi:hypothetical protein
VSASLCLLVKVLPARSLLPFRVSLALLVFAIGVSVTPRLLSQG